MADLLLELFSEEIPARMQSRALEDLRSQLVAALKKDGLNVGEEIGYVTPRRLAVWLMDIPAAIPPSEVEIKGPKTSAPEQALNGFLNKNNLTKDQLTERDGVYYATQSTPERNAADIIQPAIEQILSNFPWPKSMRWGSGATSWVRPLHSMICIFDGGIIPVSFAGIKASNQTRGHRFLAPDAITIANASDYESALEKAFVIADREKRKNSIKAQTQEAAKKAGLKIREDNGLLEEVTGLVEWPVVLLGSIDARYMQLPQEVLVLEMRNHQKYFALENDKGELADKFLITANIPANDSGSAIIAGNERVLRARLADGEFFWEQDRKKTLEQWAQGLADVTYHAKIGTVAEKVSRIKALAGQLAEYVSGADRQKAEQAASLCKADLVTGMVGEFPELQGIMGGYYAKAEKLDDSIVTAIQEHYKPLGPSDEVPTDPIATCVALADKLDTLCGLFAVDEKPTGSKDPFALRRMALGIIRIILENNVRLPLQKVTGKQGDVFDFIIDRLKVMLKDDGIRHDVINAVISGGDDDLVRIVARAKALQELLNTEDGTNLLAAYNRAANILTIEQKKDQTSYAADQLDTAQLQQAEEKALAKALADMQPQRDKLMESEDFSSAIRLLANLRAPLDAFFDHTMVNCDEPKLRMQRLYLLANIRQAMDDIADFSAIETDQKVSKKKAA